MIEHWPIWIRRFASSRINPASIRCAGSSCRAWDNWTERSPTATRRSSSIAPTRSLTRRGRVSGSHETIIDAPMPGTTKRSGLPQPTRITGASDPLAGSWRVTTTKQSKTSPRPSAFTPAKTSFSLGAAKCGCVCSNTTRHSPTLARRSGSIRTSHAPISAARPSGCANTTATRRSPTYPRLSSSIRAIPFIAAPVPIPGRDRACTTQRSPITTRPFDCGQTTRWVMLARPGMAQGRHGRQDGLRQSHR